MRMKFIQNLSLLPPNTMYFLFRAFRLCPPIKRTAETTSPVFSLSILAFLKADFEELAFISKSLNVLLTMKYYCNNLYLIVSTKERVGSK